MDPYKEALKDDAESDSDESSEDEDFDVSKAERKMQVEKDSSEGSGSEPDEEYDSEGAVSDDMVPTKKSKKGNLYTTNLNDIIPFQRRAKSAKSVIKKANVARIKMDPNVPNLLISSS